jgi:hypothetical protein
MQEPVGPESSARSHGIGLIHVGSLLMSMNAKQRKTALKKRRKYRKFREQRRGAAHAAGTSPARPAVRRTSA